MKSNQLIEKDLPVLNVLALIFIPPTLLMTTYVILGYFLQSTIPALLLFFLCALLILFPIEIAIILRASKKEYAQFSLKSAFSLHEKSSISQTLIYAICLFGYAGLMSLIVPKLEGMIFSSIEVKLFDLIPIYFNWNFIDNLKQYSSHILWITFVVYVILNVFIGPIVEELYFRGYLTSKMKRYKNAAPFIITVLFSLYHFWLPFNNLFRIIVFFPAFFIAFKKRNIYIAIVYHCLCNLISAISFLFILLEII